MVRVAQLQLHRFEASHPCTLKAVCPKAANILPNRATVAASLANWNHEQQEAVPSNGVVLSFDCEPVYVTNGIEFAQQQPHQQFLNFPVTASHVDPCNYDYNCTQETNVLTESATASWQPNELASSNHLEPRAEPTPDHRLEVIQRALDFIGNICENRQVDGLWGAKLLERKVRDVRRYILDENETLTSGESEGEGTASGTSVLLNEIDQRIGDLSSTIDCVRRTQATNRDPMGFDLLNRIRHWFLLGGRSNANDPPKVTESNDNESTRKRSYPSLSNEGSAQHLIKYRRVDNTFPKYMPNAVDDYSHMADPNQRKEQGNNSNQAHKRLSMFTEPQTRNERVRNTNASIAIDLSDTEEQKHNETNIYQALADRLVSDSEQVAPPRLGTEYGRSASSTRPNLLYSDAVRYGTNGFVADRSYPRPFSSVEPNETRLNGHANNLYNTAATVSNRDNVMLLQERRIEHNQYIHLINNLTLQEQENPIPHRSATARGSIVKPPPPPPVQRVSLHGDEWLRGLIKKKAPPFSQLCSERDDYAKLLDSKSKHEQKQHATKLKKSPPKLMQCYSLGSNVSSFKTMANDKDQMKKSYMFPPQSQVSCPMTKALQLRHNSSVYFAENYSEIFNEKCARLQQENNHAKKLILQEVEKTTEDRRAYEQGLRENLTKRRFLTQSLFVLEKIQQPVDKSKPEILPLTNQHLQRFNELIKNGPPQQVLVSKFSLNITRSDIRTLTGSCWLNDEVINFYMNMLTDRSQRREDELPSVYAMNTFFVPRLLQNGHGAVKRWTRKVDIFTKDIIPVPVHVGGVHWCMAIIHMKNKSIRYYDSMGKPNHGVLSALEMYLREESLDKRKRPFDTSDFQIENVPNVPQQKNGSDCGVFSCMFAEYITRNMPLNFSQEHMEYFRKKMVLEICGGELWM